MTATNSVAFSQADVGLLYSLPSQGCDLVKIISIYTFIHRSAPPSFKLVQECITKALQTGILSEEDGMYQISPSWYQRIHANDDLAGSEIHSMIEFEDAFVGEEVPVTCDMQFKVTEDQYEVLTKDMQK